MFEAMDAELKDLLDHQIAGLDAQIEQTVTLDEELAATAVILRSAPGIGPFTSVMLIAEMPELGQITGAQAAALTGLAPIAHDSGAMRGKRTIDGGRRLPRYVMFQAALVASHHNPVLKTFADHLRAAGKPHKVVITAIARKLVTILNALCKARQKWTPQTSWEIQLQKNAPKRFIKVVAMPSPHKGSTVRDSPPAGRPGEGIRLGDQECSVSSLGPRRKPVSRFAL